MKAEFHRPDDEERTPLAEARWLDARVEVRADDGDIAEALRKAFRSSPVVTDDAAFRRMGTYGEVVLQPGNVEWFLAAALVRAPRETGLAATIVPEVTEGGYDPAADYRPFGEELERLAGRSTSRGTDPRP